MNNIKETVLEVIYSILPIAIVITVLQFTIIWLPSEACMPFLPCVFFIVMGLILVLLGVNVGLVPVGEMIGSALSKTKKIWTIVLFGFLLGAVVTFAEPDVRVLSSQIDDVSGGAIPQSILIMSVALGVGIFV